MTPIGNCKSYQLPLCEKCRSADDMSCLLERLSRMQDVYHMENMESMFAFLNGFFCLVDESIYVEKFLEVAFPHLLRKYIAMRLLK